MNTELGVPLTWGDAWAAPAAPPDDWESFVDQAFQGRRDIENVSLPPDQRYQLHPVTLRQVHREVADSVASSVRELGQKNLPELVVAWGKCRVGSTSLARNFGMAGIPSYYQPVKNLLRYRLLGLEPPLWQIPDGRQHPVVFIKETGGPYRVAESFFNPLPCLLEAGFPKHKLHVLVLERDPYKTFASWLQHWAARAPEKALLFHFVVASLNLHRVERFARAQGLKTSWFVHELSRKPEMTIRALFEKLGLGSIFEPRILVDWKNASAADGKRLPLIFPQEPPVYVAPGIHSDDNAYHYKDRDAEGLRRECRATIERWRLPQLHAQVVVRTAETLGLDETVFQTVYDMQSIRRFAADGTARH